MKLENSAPQTYSATLSSQQVQGNLQTINVGGASSTSDALCPAGTVVSGGGYIADNTIGGWEDIDSGYALAVTSYF